MQFDFSEVEDVENYVSIPEGTYLCRVAEVREGENRDGSPRWAMRLEVAEGDYAGRTAAWDGLAWSERGTRRVKFVLDKLGFDTSGPLELEPSDLEGRLVVAQLQTEEREDPLTGTRVLRLVVPYLGYETADAARDGHALAG